MLNAVSGQRGQPICPVFVDAPQGLPAGAPNLDGMKASLFALLILAGLLPANATPPAGVWLAGDLHVHTIWSKDVCETPQLKNTRDASDPSKPCTDPTTWGWAPEQQLQNAQQRGMHFLALTDHNTNRHLSDPALLAYDGPVTMLPGVEFTLDGGEGHAGILGWTHGKPADPTPADGRYTASDMGSIADAAHAAGALFSINHPMNPAWGLGFPDADAVEVWNYPWSSMVLPVIGSENTRAVGWWEDNYLRAGRRAAAVGGSDNHWRSTGEVQGVGQPTTWVFASENSVDAILAAIRAGRTTVSAEPPARGGARLFLTSGDAIVGDTVDAGPQTFSIRIEGGAGSVVRAVTPDGIAFEAPVTSADETVEFAVTLPAGGWLRAELFIPDLSSERAAACKTSGADRATDDLNEALTGAGETFIDGASETRPLNVGPCVVAQMLALTSPIWAS